MAPEIERLLEQLKRVPFMLASEFETTLSNAYRSGETVSDVLSGSRSGDALLHALAKDFPNRADLLLIATNDDRADLNAPNDYGLTVADLLAGKGANTTLIELLDAERPLNIDSLSAKVSGHESAYRIALAEAPYQLISVMHDHSARMADKGLQVGQIYPKRLGRNGETILHEFAERSDLAADDFVGYIDELQTALGLSGSDIKDLLQSSTGRNKPFLFTVADRDPSLALRTINALDKALGPEMFDRQQALRGDYARSSRNLSFAAPENSCLALQLADHTDMDAEQLMIAIIEAVEPKDLHVQARNGETPLSIMAQKGWGDALKAALEAGVDPNYGVDSGARNPLNEAMLNSARPDQAYGIVKQLIATDLDSRWLATPSAHSPSVLKFAIDYADPALAYQAMLLGADVDGHPGANYSPLRSAIEKYETHPDVYEKIIRRLVFNGASLKKVDADMLSPAARLSHPEMAAARDYVTRLSVINGLSSQYGLDYATAAIEGFNHSHVTDLSRPRVSLGTLQMIPGMTRALVDLLKHEQSDSAVLNAVLKVNAQTDPEIPAMDLVDKSRTLLAIPEANRMDMSFNISHLRAELGALDPMQVSPEAIETYQSQIMAANRLAKWVNASLELPDTPDAAAKLSAEHGRFIERSITDFSHAIKAAPMLLSPSVDQLPLQLGVDGSWKANVTLSGERHFRPDSGSPASLLFAEREDGTVKPRADIYDGNSKVLTYVSSVADVDANSGVNTGYIKLNSACVVFADNPMVDKFIVNEGLLREMGFDGALIYDLKNSRVAGAIDFSGERFDFPAGVTVTPNTNPELQKNSLEVEDAPKPSEPSGRRLGM
jgi:hypothetical protein